MINNSETTTTTTTRPTTTTTKKFFIAFIPHDEDVGIEIPDPLLEDGPMVDGLQVRMGCHDMPRIEDTQFFIFQDISSLSGQGQIEAAAVTLTGSIGLPTVPMVTFWRLRNIFCNF